MGQRINVMISDEVNLKLNVLSKKYGMAKSAMCAFVIGQWLDQKETVENALFSNDAVLNYINELNKNNDEK